MWIYNSFDSHELSYRIHDDANLLLLRKDLHTSLFDEKFWAFVPRRGHPAVSYLRRANDSLLLYHGRATHSLHVHPAYLYSRFAWAVLPLSLSFGSLRGAPVKIWDASKCKWKEKAEVSRLQPRPTGKRKPASQGGPSTPKVQKTSGKALNRTPPSTNLRDQKFINELYQNAGGQGSLLWDSGYYPGIEKVEALKRRLVAKAYYGLGDVGGEEIVNSEADTLKYDDNDDEDSENGDGGSNDEDSENEDERMEEGENGLGVSVL